MKKIILILTSFLITLFFCYSQNWENWEHYYANTEKGPGRLIVDDSTIYVSASSGINIYDITGKHKDFYYTGSHTRDFAIDSENNKWFAVYDKGVLKYDNENWTWVTNEDGLVNNKVLTIVCDHNDNIWVGHDLHESQQTGEIGLTKYDGEDWSVYSELGELYDTLHLYGGHYITSKMVRRLVIDNDNRIFIYLASFGVVVIDEAENEMIAYEAGTYPTGIFETKVAYRDNNNHIWFAGGSGLIRFDGTEWHDEYDTDIFGHSTSIRIIFMDASDNLWVGTCDKGIFKKTNGEWIVYDDTNYLKNNCVMGITSDNYDNIWISNYNWELSGPACLSLYDNNDFYHFYPNFYYPLSFHGGNDINFADNKTWLLSATSSHFPSKSQRLSVLEDGIWSINNIEGLPYDSLKSITTDNANNVWFGSLNGLYKIEPDNDFAVHYTELCDISLGNILNIASYNNIIWIVTDNNFIKFDGIQCTNIDFPEFSITRTTKIIPRNENELWFILGYTGGLGGELWKYDGSAWINYSENENLPAVGYCDIGFEDEKIWFVTLGGVLMFDGEEWTSYFEDSTINNRPRNIFIDNQNLKWFGMPSGHIYLFDDVEFNFMPPPKGKVGVMFSIKIDNDGNIWVVGSLGLSKYTPDDAFINELSLSEARINVYPNPVSDILHIDINENISQIKIYNISGQLIFEKSSDISNEIDISHLNNGIYIIHFVSKNDTFQTKFVVGK